MSEKNSTTISPLRMRRLVSSDEDFSSQLTQLVSWEDVSDSQVVSSVDAILRDVRERGDEAVVDLTNRFDRRMLKNASEFFVDEQVIEAAVDNITKDQLVALKTAADRIRSYHLHQKQDSWSYQEANGNVLGQQVTPIGRVGVYVPGGKAVYPSTVLMNVIPASVAGVEDIVMVSPTPDDQINDVLLAAAKIAGVTRVFTIGGAQAVAALAYGTDTVPKVDKIVGPGNIYVATAKKMLFGQVGLDMVAGPSEILIVCDGKTNPDWIAMDLFSQAEHDELAQALLISDNAEFLQQVEKSINKLLPEMEREEIIASSLSNRSAFILVKDMDDAIRVTNKIAPEHLELSIENADQWVSKIRNAGAIFVGRHTSEAVGDYCAGPNHVLPTSATARFSSPLGVYDFQKRSSVIHCSKEGASELGKIASVLGRSEQLTAHARSAEYRINDGNSGD